MIIVWAKTGVAWMERSLRSVIQVLLAERMIMATNGHDHRLGHSNLQESQLAKVDSDAKEGAGRNDDQGPSCPPYYYS